MCSLVCIPLLRGVAEELQRVQPVYLGAQNMTCEEGLRELGLGDAEGD